ncbi:hypothetical protein ACJMK2_033497 [Sinanodonta woodiana]|uniref:Methyltransferase FkbM domain-containing protein n=1 Tax=Sinanodonta woodiana TaxID=1069815 RepID=A0ABD3WNI9_SINWO
MSTSTGKQNKQHQIIAQQKSKERLKDANNFEELECKADVCQLAQFPNAWFDFILFRRSKVSVMARKKSSLYFIVTVLGISGVCVVMYFRTPQDTLSSPSQEPDFTATTSVSKYFHQVSKNSCVKTRTVPNFNICLYPLDRDKFISRSLLYNGVWEPYFTKVFQSALQNVPNATVLDIGANIGYYTLLSGAMGHKVIAIEPVTANILHLQESLKLNKFKRKIWLLRYAVSNKQAKLYLTENRNNQGGFRVVPKPPQKLKMVQTYNAITLDDVLSIVKVEEAIIKIDTEGYECKILESSSEFFKHVKVPYIFMEWQIMSGEQKKYGAPCPAVKIRNISLTLGKMGYTAFELRYGIELDVAESDRWRVEYVYWLHSNAKPLQRAID